jgi:hypothetical protein
LYFTALVYHTISIELLKWPDKRIFVNHEIQVAPEDSSGSFVVIINGSPCNNKAIPWLDPKVLDQPSPNLWDGMGMAAGLLVKTDAWVAPVDLCEVSRGVWARGTGLSIFFVEDFVDDIF